MGDHPLFHNGSTAKLFPAISALSPDRISAMYGVPPVDRRIELEQETLYHEPATVIAANYAFREVSSPVREQMRTKLSSRGGTSSLQVSNNGRIPLSTPTNRGRIGETSSGYQPPSPYNYTHSRPSTATVTATTRPVPFISGGNPKIARSQISSQERISSIFTGFDVDEDIKQKKIRELNESITQQMKICCLTPNILREGGLASSASSPRPGTNGSNDSTLRSGSGRSQSTRSSPRKGRVGVAAQLSAEDDLLTSVKSSFRPFSRGTVGEAQESLVRKNYLNNGDNDTAWSIKSLEAQRIKNGRHRM